MSLITKEDSEFKEFDKFLAFSLYSSLVGVHHKDIERYRR